MSKKVLVTGGAGYVGTFVVNDLLQKGYKVVVLDSLVYGDEGLNTYKSNKNLKFHSGDISELRDVEKAIKGVDYVIALAAIVGDPACSLSNDHTWKINLDSTKILLKAAKKLKDEGATAIAVVTRFPDEYECLDEYLQGKGVDLLAGAEAVISHLIVKELNLPSAHSPAIKTFQMNFDIDPRAAAEEIGHTFLPSVLVGLSRAPDLIPASNQNLITAAQSTSLIQVEDLKLVVVPSTALGGEAVLACIERGIDLIMVDNESAMNVGPNELGLEDNSYHLKGFNFYTASSYVEAAGLILALRNGICIKSLRRPIKSVFLN